MWQLEYSQETKAHSHQAASVVHNAIKSVRRNQTDGPHAFVNTTSRHFRAFNANHKIQPTALSALDHGETTNTLIIRAVNKTHQAAPIGSALLDCGRPEPEGV